MFLRYLLCTCLFLLCSKNELQAQLDTIHWLPPMYPGISFVSPYLDMTTPEEDTFPVSIRDGAGNLLLTVLISNGQPVRYNLNPFYNKVLVPQPSLHKALPNTGLVLSGPKPFYASFRAITDDAANACFLVCKGRPALGRVFRIGHVRQVTDKTGDRFNMIGILATEDSTVVKLSGFDPLTAFKMGFFDDLVADPVTMTLQRGQSVVFAHYIGDIGDDQPRNGFMGALLEASKPVAVNSGSWMGAPVVFQVADIGVDQILPLESVGKEYILCRGNGQTSLEHPILVAHTNGTKVWLNGKTTPDTTLQAGEYYVVPATYYLPDSSMFIRTSEPAFVYQMLGGFPTGPTCLGTVSLMFIPPISCGLLNKVDNIYLPNQLDNTGFAGHLMIVAMRDSAVTVRFDGVEKNIGPPTPVPGNDDFVTYRAMDILVRTKPVKRLSVTSGGAIQTTLIARYEGASYAATFSGTLIRKPEIHVMQHGDGICPDTLSAGGVFDEIQWMYEDSLLQNSTDSFLVILAPGPYKAIGNLYGCRSTARVADSLVASLSAPQFQYFITEPSCFGFSDGQIAFGLPNGGTPPYLFSIDHGANFSAEPFFDQLRAGKYTLVAADESGCYNQPIRLEMGQPDSAYVNLTAVQLPAPLRPGEEVVLEGLPSHPVAATTWSPPGSFPCPDCLRDTFYPEQSTWVTLTTFDPGGCSVSDSLLLFVESPVFAPNAIRPGSSTGNDRFVLSSDHPLLVHSLSIFDRWGNEVFSRQNFFTNNPDDGWDGVFRGKSVLPGIYVFVASVEVAQGKVIELTGDILVVQ